MYLVSHQKLARISRAVEEERMADLVRTLVVDDEERICRFVKTTLQREGHVVTMANTGEEALEILQSTSFDVAILDLMLGGRVDGQRVLEAIRWRWPGTVVIMFTAHGTLESALNAIREGVDGYLLKPVRADEVRRAVQEALARRQLQTETRSASDDRQVFKVGAFSANLDSHQATRDGQPLDLTPSEFKLLVHLMQNPGQAISPPELVEIVRQYEPEYLHEARQIIKWYIHRLRQKVEADPSNPRHVLNVRGVGYLFEP
jgi:DNA-binding response OmpR family regulator